MALQRTKRELFDDKVALNEITYGHEVDATDLNLLIK